ncbi:glucose-1-phosphate cytidylyltransferase [Halioglobus maricola]|uniref:Glucose-1-phosphate cytidylyltransferase n=1 Tax=Halioglobus maricola TaxID=2601894 RepID=A0A5P9NP60_9GAMM|nr:glucose-1-phosphate cytidylyltransferase [Halioglobus maricola]QFU77663.1 glucose-1-phosphate cytidylyltransferase [Halioglobus maricola]
MKIAILAGGFGSRLGIETESKPKPLVEIGGRPILWHIMHGFQRWGLDDFVIALGYKGDMIKKYMADYARLHGNLRIELGNNEIHHHDAQPLDWNVELIETGQRTQTGGRILRLKPFVGNQTFILAWGDGLSTVDVDALLQFHQQHGKLATVTAVRPPARFGHLEFEGDRVAEFSEKPQTAEGWINGGIFVLEPGVFEYIEGDDTHWEREPMENLARDGQLMAYRHEGFWQCLDTPRDLALLNRLWNSGSPPWQAAKPL